MNYTPEDAAIAIPQMVAAVQGETKARIIAYVDHLAGQHPDGHDRELIRTVAASIAANVE